MMIFTVFLAIAAIGVKNGFGSEDVLLVRLTNGTSPCSGRVEIFHNQSWGTVCDDYWDLADVVVVCRQLGCGFAELAHGSATFGAGTDNIWLDDVRCEGMEQNLGECTSQHLGKHNCHHREDAGAVCNRDQPPKPTLSLSRNADELVRGEDILIYCGSLGFYNNAAFYLYREGQSSPIASRTPASRGNSAAFLLTNVNEGQEGNYSCGYDVEESGRVFTSARSQSLTIVVKDQLKGPKIRDNARASILVRGQSLEITCEAPIFLSGCRFHLHKRGDDSFKASMVATARSNSVTFQISDITSREEGNYSCDYQAEIAGKFFNSTPSLDLKVEVIDDLDLRLVDGQSRCSGFVQVFFNGTWGSVCGSSWDIADAQVVCRQIGCGFANTGLPLSAHDVMPPVHLSVVRCGGAERYLWVCPARAWTKDLTCDRGGTAKVTCTDQPSEPVFSISGKGMYFKGESIQILCSVTSLYRGAKMLLFRDGQTEPLMSANVTSSQNTVKFNMTNINKTHDGKYWCSYQIEVAEIAFQSANSLPKEIAVVEDMDLRLAGGTNSCSGRVESFYNGTWGTICASGWDILNVQVVCSQLGCGFGRAVVPGGHFGEASGPILFDEVRCTGLEEFIWSCPSQKLNTRTCRVRNDAGVICSDRPQQPEIVLLRPLGFYAQGETIEIQCVSPPYLRGGTFNLEKEGDPSVIHTVVAAENISNVNFSIENINLTQAGVYRCWYQIQKQGRRYNSTASEQVKVSVIERPSGPLIRIFRDNSRYSLGEFVDIQCTAPSVIRGAIFNLRKVGAEEVVESKLSSGFAATFTIVNVTYANGGNYTCSYQLKRSGQLYNSTESNAINVYVTDELQRPVIAVLRPMATFVPGEDIIFRCSASSVFAEITFFLYKVGESGAVSVEGPNTSSNAKLTIYNMTNVQESYFTCMFKVAIGKRVYLSTHSDRVKISISDFTEAPSISLKFPFKVYPQGQILTFICTAPKQYQPRDFQLYKEKHVPATRVDLRGGSAEFTILNTSLSDQGDYVCTYQTTIKNRRYNSSASDPFSLIVAENMLHRLTNGTNRCNGRVEIFFGDQWGTICDDHWGLLDAQVVCRSTGCGVALTAPTHAKFGRGIGPIWLDDVGCRGDELALWQCGSRIWGQHNCQHGEDASAVCSGIKPTIGLVPDYGIFVNGEMVKINCTIEGRNTSHRIDFYKDLSYLGHRNLDLEVQWAVFEIANISGTDVGNYSCMFQNQVSGAAINSSMSSPALVAVTDPLPMPTIDLLTVEGQQVVNCSVDTMRGNSTMKLFQLRPDGTKQIQSVQMSNCSSTFHLNTTGSAGENRYACLYQVQVSGRSLKSSYTQYVQVTTSGSSNVKSIVGWLLAVLIAVLVLVASVLYCKRSKTSGLKREYRIYVRERLLDDMTHIEAIDDEPAQ